jgi:murein DD-endopeptidase MepM/ murein hydrolase activator NlpD
MTIILLFSLVLTTGFTNINNEPHTVYRVYLKGESLGIIKSKKSLENYIDSKQEQIKRKYNVSKVYVPTDLDIVKETTFSNELKTNKQIYDAIKDSSPFTIDGYIVKIRGTETKKNGQVEKTKSQIIYVLKKSVFTNSIERTVKSFISNEDYENYANGTQKEIEDTGKIIEALYIKNKITIKKAKIPVDKQIYESEEDLSKYLLFGTTEPQATYTIKDGDTIRDVAFNNKISTEEFLIADPDLHDENALLAPGQIVTLGILKPQFSLVEESEVVTREEQNYTTETRYDNNQYVGYESVLQAGVKGENRMTYYVQKVNGENVNMVNTGKEVLREPVNEIIVKGGKQSYYWGGGYGSAIATRGQWGWPATCSNISSGYGWRWGSFHDGTDIAGCGYGSSIFAAQSGTVVKSEKKPGYFSGGYGDNGEYIIIDHHNGFFTMYAHMCPGCRSVSEGDYVEKGQVIGGMGQTGWATGVHLHFAIWQGRPYGPGSSTINPMGVY